jgi:hypothetical protein
LLSAPRAAELQGCEPGVETGALREPNARLFDDTAVFDDDNTVCVLHGGEPMSNHDGFVGPAHDRAPAAQVVRPRRRARKLALSSSSLGAFFTAARVIERRWRRHSALANRCVYPTCGGAVKQSAAALVAT